jgi:hypothetical protein
MVVCNFFLGGGEGGGGYMSAILEYSISDSPQHCTFCQHLIITLQMASAVHDEIASSGKVAAATLATQHCHDLLTSYTKTAR